MVVSSKFSSKGQVKSISLPSRSHPTTVRIEQELNAAKTAAAVAASKPSVDNICIGLLCLAELYKCMDDLLNLSATRVLVTGEQNKKWVEELVEESVSLLDVCCSVRDMVAQMKAHVRDVQSVLRRRKSELSNEKSVINYNCFRKKMKKDVKMLAGCLKQVDNMTSGGSVVVDSNNHHLAAVMKAVIGVSETTVSVFESLLLLLSLPNSKPNRWAIVVSKLMHKGIVACEDQQEHGIGNEFDSVDDALQSLCKNGSSMQLEKMQIAKCRLEMLESQLEYMEIRLECVFRRLIGSRATLLNIISL
ncbi:hypothetical protein HanXRQr2_Chr14g0643751 [Helianthus annuus]|uniref:Uncharacterized protein n=1 Tax=Helianthus annuus TaxID=4232 RepID=A0A251SH26_HELAN|nr:uncharacterized protein LOC110907185 [Helianthus annuus]KAF5769055.1 hypothetical protein HanXRQr2_Chr14g0643751 [Helianthus annuus]KAJ0485732.1 hypothetical protein HanHA89_Chr14g0571621 [Helianthus annuus]KAJ0656285.1 hypothetical protein HanLR1_Chr14g0534021 [Helianthus annuus]KAJ0840348.1 hypothetical protein HanPSC8_Chr14g0617631 [Helianthus annuus]